VVAVKFKRSSAYSLIPAVILFLSTCGSTSVQHESMIKREKRILSQYSELKKEKYSGLLVSLDSYTTNGYKYQKKYYKYLIGLAGDITENQKMTIDTGSLGFYYDNKSKDNEGRNKFYLGLDIQTGKEFKKNYSESAFSLLKNNIRKIINTVNSCRSIFEESEVVGMVIGFKWKAYGHSHLMNIWITENDVFLFENNKLTFNEVLQRSIITNTSGKIIRLQL